MKSIAFLLLLAFARHGLGQTDTNLVAAGDWSEPVADRDGSTLRGRLLVYGDQGQGAANHARVYLELQHVFHSAWYNPLEIYYNIGSSDDLRFELRDALGQPVPQTPMIIRGPLPPPCWVTLPCDSTLRLRADTYTLGPPSKPSGFELLVRGGCWILPSNTTNAVFLSATFTPPKDHPSPLHYHVWQGTLKLGKVRIPVKKP